METIQINDAADATEQDKRYIIVLKVGGNELDDEAFLVGLANAVQSIRDDGAFPVIVHGDRKSVV